MTKISRLEDFGTKDTVSPRERYNQYVKDCKSLPKQKQGKFWLAILEQDPQVRRLLDLDEKKRRGRF